MLRTLKYYWPLNAAVVAGAAVASAVLTGALLVGDSVRSSLRVLTLDRLGGIHTALVAGHFFREELASELPGVAPAIIVRGSARGAGGGTASRVAIHGVDARFFELFGAGQMRLEPVLGELFPPLAVNDALARELGVERGGSVILRFSRSSEVPRDTLMGDADLDSVLGTLRLTVSEVVPDRGIGRFGLGATQHVPLNAFVPLDRLQRALGATGQVNALLAGERLQDPDGALARVVRFEDYGLTLAARGAFLELGSRELVVSPAVVRAAREVAASLGAPVQTTQAYLANRLRVGERAVPYSLVAALDPRPDLEWASLTLVDGPRAPAIGPSGILLNAWAAEDLAAQIGDEVELSYFAVGPREELREETARLVVEGVVAMVGLGADRGLTPDYPGLRETEDLAAWDPPFPLDMSSMRPADETYWDDHGATPKAFVGAATGERLWATRHGHVTSVRVGAAPGGDLARLESAFESALRERLAPVGQGLDFEPVREQGLAAAQGTTDFGQLFLAFSAFLIVSAALLSALLFRLGVERRAGEIGLRLATGYRVRAVRSRLLAEGMLLATLGGGLGTIAGVGYAALMMAGLRTLWRPAVGSSELELAVVPASMVLGFLVALAVVAVSILFSVSRLVRVAPARLLAGAVHEPRRRRSGLGLRLLAWGGVPAAVALALSFGATSADGSARAALAFLSGTLLLVSSLALFALWCRRSRRRTVVGRRRALVAMAARNSAWLPGRSIVSVGLVAAATFVIAVVAASRSATEEPLVSRASGAGGFALLAEADVALDHDLASPAGRAELGFPETAARAFDGVEVFPFRRRSGDDASCLNLYRPQEPRLLGVSAGFVARGGFAFREHAELPRELSSPWQLLARPLEPGVIPAIADANSAMWILHLGLGDELTLVDESGRPVRLRLVGLLARSVFQSELLIAEASLLEHFPSVSGDAYFLIDVPPNRAGELAQQLEQTLDPFGFDVTPSGERLAGYRVVENTYMATFELLGALGLLLGTIGLAVVLLRNVIERRGELATLRAMGFRRGLLAWLVLAENAFLLGVGLAIGTAAALAAVGPRLLEAPPSWGALFAMLGLVLATGMLASAAAVLGAVRAPMLPALKAEH